MVTPLQGPSEQSSAWRKRESAQKKQEETEVKAGAWHYFGNFLLLFRALFLVLVRRSASIVRAK